MMTQPQNTAAPETDASRRALMLWGAQHDEVRRAHDDWQSSFGAQAALIYGLQGGGGTSGRKLALDAEMIEQTERLASSLAELGQRMRAYRDAVGRETSSSHS